MAHLFVGQLPFSNFFSANLYDIFEKYGTIIASKLNLKRGEAFVTFEHTFQADAAIAALHNKHVVKGRRLPLQVMYANSSLKWSWYGLHHNICLHHQNRLSVKLPQFLIRTPPLSPTQWLQEPTLAKLELLNEEDVEGESPLPEASDQRRGSRGGGGNARGESSTTTTTTGTTSSSPLFSTSSPSTSTRSSGLSSGSTNNSKQSQSSSLSKNAVQRKRPRDTETPYAEGTSHHGDSSTTRHSGNCSSSSTKRSAHTAKGSKEKKRRLKKKLRVEDEENIEVEAAEPEDVSTSAPGHHGSMESSPLRLQQQRIFSHLLHSVGGVNQGQTDPHQSDTPSAPSVLGSALPGTQPSASTRGRYMQIQRAGRGRARGGDRGRGTRGRRTG